MAEWRIGRRWSERELEGRLKRLEGARRNFDEDPESLPVPGWRTYSSEAIIATCDPGLPRPGGPFERGREALARYEFSDRRIVRAYFDPAEPLTGRCMLLQISAFRLLNYLSGVVVGAVRSERSDDETAVGFRYDTLEGHIERGTEWFLLRKQHDTGAIRFRISACWKPGDFPNWWSGLGFRIFGPHYVRSWHSRAHQIMSTIVRRSQEGAPDRPEWKRARPDILFERSKSNA